MLLSSLPITLHLFLQGFLQRPEAIPTLDFRLRHAHSSSLNDSTRVIFNDVPPHLAETSEMYSVQTRSVRTHKPPSLTSFNSARWAAQSPPWREEYVVGPDVERRETLRQLAKMTSNSYYKPNTTDWYDLGPDWNKVCSPPSRTLIFVVPNRCQTDLLLWLGA